jgi:hypothetical protein
MTTAVLDPDAEWSLNPEAQTVAETYLMYSDVRLTAKELGIPREKVTYYLNRPEVKRFLDTIFLEQGYLNRSRLQDVLDEVFELKLEEMRESEMGSKKDIADLIALAHKIRTDEAKTINVSDAPNVKTQVNIQNNTSSDFGSNYNSLLEKLVK